MIRLGEHYLVELARCNSRVLSNPGRIENILLNSCKEANAHRVDHKFYSHSDGGVSGVIVIEESHISIHTFPKQEYAVADFFTCSEKVNEEEGIEVLAEKIGCKKYGFSRLDRGIMPDKNKKSELNKHDGLVREEKSIPNSSQYENGSMKHLILEAWGVEPEKIKKKQTLEKHLLEASLIGGMSVVYHNFHEFSPHGASGFILGYNSHTTIHTWPEHGYAAIDVLAQKGNTKNFDFEKIAKSLLDYLNPEQYSKSYLERGFLNQ